MYTLYDILMDELDNNTAKVECVIDYLKKQTTLLEHLNTFADREFQLLIRDASSACSFSALTTPLGIGIIVSILILSLVVVCVLFGRIIKK
jgi:hypothetical protein